MVVVVLLLEPLGCRSAYWVVGVLIHVLEPIGWCMCSSMLPSSCVNTILWSIKLKLYGLCNG